LKTQLHQAQAQLRAQQQASHRLVSDAALSAALTLMKQQLASRQEVAQLRSELEGVKCGLEPMLVRLKSVLAELEDVKRAAEGAASSETTLQAKLSTDAEGQTEQPFQEAEKGNVTERGPAEDCPREFVHGIVLQTETAIEGLAQEGAAACAREAAEGYVTKTKAVPAAEAANHPQQETSGVIEPRGMHAAEKAVSEDQGAEHAVPPAASVGKDDGAAEHVLLGHLHSGNSGNRIN